MPREHLLSLNGEIRSASEWAQIVGIDAATICARKARGYSDERALLEPVARSGRPGLAPSVRLGIRMDIQAGRSSKVIAHKYGVHVATVNRLRRRARKLLQK